MLETVERVRDISFDALRGLLIAMIVLGHWLEVLPAWGWQNPVQSTPLLSHTLLSWLYALHIPCLVFLSGLWFNRDKALWRTAKLFGWYLGFQLLYIALYFTLTGVYEPESLYLIKPFWLMWYLMALMIWNLLAYAINARHKALWFALSLIAGCAIAFLPKGEHHFYFSIGRVLVFAPVFLLGVFYGQNALQLANRLPIWLAFLILGAIFTLLHFDPKPYSWLLGRANARGFGLNVADVVWIQSALWLLSGAGILALLRLRTMLWQGFASWGLASFAVYLLHGLPITIFSLYYQEQEFPIVDPILSLLLALTCTLILCALTSRTQRWIRL